LISGDRPGVAENLREERAVRVLATGLDRDFHARQLEARLRDQARGLLGHVRGDPDGVVAGARVAVDRGIDVELRHAGQRGQPRNDLVATVFGEIGRPDLDGERRHVRDQNVPRAVVDEAAARRDRLEGGPVAL
jgi:hypothetical protein